MVKQTKKGSIGKKALSAILAASMIMTSSSFVMAAPVVEEVEPVAVVEEVAAQAEEVDVVDESARAVVQDAKVVVTDIAYAGKALNNEIDVEVSLDDGTLLTENKDYTISYLDASKNPITEVKDAGDYFAKITLGAGHSSAAGTSTIEKAFKVTPFVIKANDLSVEYTQTGYIYNGEKQAPTPVVTIKDAPADFKDAFEVVAVNSSDMISAGDQTIKLALKANATNYTTENATTLDKTEKTYKIDQSNDFRVTVSADDKVYNGSAKQPNVVVKNAQGKEVDSTTEYTVECSQNGKVVADPVDIGTYDIKVTTTGNGNYKKDLVAYGSYKIVASNLASLVKNATISNTTKDADGNYILTYNGTEQAIAVSDITINDANPSDYTITPAAGAKVTNAGDTATFTVTGKNTWAGQSATLTVKVAPKEMKNVQNSGFSMDAKASKGVTSKDNVIPSITDNTLGKELVNGKDYTVESIDTKKRTILVKGLGNYTTPEDSKGNANAGVEVTYTVSDKVYLEDSRITVDAIADQTWTGNAITPVVVVKDTTVTPAKPLVQGTDYDIQYSNNINTGKATITITAKAGSADYEGTKTVEFNIVGTDISKTYKLAPMDSVPLKKAATPATPALVYITNGASAPVEVTKDVKYFSDDQYKNEITSTFANYINSIDLSNGPVFIYVKVTGTGKYSGEVTGKYEIVGDTTFTVVDEKIADQAYTGKAIEPEVAVKDADTNAPLTKDKDYTVTYENNTKVGVAYITIKGIGKYEGTKVLSFNIVGEMDQEIAVLPAQEKALKTRTLNSDATKVKFTKAPETTVTYTSSDEDVVTVDANGNIKYTGLGKATITIKAVAENGYKEAVKELEVVVGLAQPTFTPFSRNNAFAVTTSTVKGAEKFQVQYVAAGKSFTSSTAKTKTFTVDKKLKQGKVAAGNKKTYRIRVRAINGSTMSKWSNVKTVATK